MNQKSLRCVATLTKFTVFISVIFSLYQPAVVAGGTQFSCKTATTEDGITVPATIAKTEKGTEIPIILWISKYFSSSGGTPQSRCNTVSNRLQRYHDNGWLTTYFTADVVNNLGVICIVRSTSSKCLNSDVIVTLPPNVNRFKALDQLMALQRNASSGKPLYLTDNLIIYRNGEAFINVKVMIDRF
jgi:hypothetical protein